MADDNQQAIAEKYRAILLIGPPGSGKGTQGRILGEVPGYWFMSMGSLLRSLDSNEEPGREIQSYLQSGDLVPAELVTSAWMQHMTAAKSNGFDPDDETLVLDGLPRNVEQAEMLHPHAAIDRIIHLQCDDEDDLVQRLRRRSRKAGRADDADLRVIEHRFEVYKKQTAPLLEHYPRHLISTVDAQRTPMAVLQQVVNVLDGHKEP